MVYAKNKVTIQRMLYGGKKSSCAAIFDLKMSERAEFIGINEQGEPGNRKACFAPANAFDMTSKAAC